MEHVVFEQVRSDVSLAEEQDIWSERCIAQMFMPSLLRHKNPEHFVRCFGGQFEVDPEGRIQCRIVSEACPLSLDIWLKSALKHYNGSIPVSCLFLLTVYFFVHLFMRPPPQY